MNHPKLVLLFGFLISYCCLNSQTLVKENSLWSTVRHGTEYGYDFESHYIKFEGDTLISDIPFKKVYRSNDSLMINWSFTGSIRETDSGSVYYLSGSADMERLLYDFGAEEGDSIKVHDEYMQYLYIDSIRYKPFGYFNEIRKFIYIRMDECRESIWIEGVGSLQGILYDSRNLCTVGEANSLVCFYENDSLKYHMDYYSSCFPYGKHTSIENKTKKTPLTIKDYNGLIVFDLNNIKNQTLFQLFDLSGRVLCTEKIRNQNSITVEKDRFENGLYIYILHTTEGYFSEKILMN